MSPQSLLLSLWQHNHGLVNRAVSALTEENRHYRLTPDSASAGFMLQHIGEATFRLLHLAAGQPFPEGKELVTVGGVKDEGQAGPLDHIRQINEEGYGTVVRFIESLTEAKLEEKVETPRWGLVSRAESVGLLMYHNSYHIGQAMLAIKRGQAYPAKNTTLAE